MGVRELGCEDGKWMKLNMTIIFIFAAEHLKSDLDGTGSGSRLGINEVKSLVCE